MNITVRLTDSRQPDNTIKSVSVWCRCLAWSHRPRRDVLHIDVDEVAPSLSSSPTHRFVCAAFSVWRYARYTFTWSEPNTNRSTYHDMNKTINRIVFIWLISYRRGQHMKWKEKNVAAHGRRRRPHITHTNFHVKNHRLFSYFVTVCRRCVRVRGLRRAETENNFSRVLLSK